MRMIFTYHDNKNTGFNPFAGMPPVPTPSSGQDLCLIQDFMFFLTCNEAESKVLRPHQFYQHGFHIIRHDGGTSPISLKMNISVKSGVFFFVGETFGLSGNHPMRVSRPVTPSGIESKKRDVPTGRSYAIGWNYTTGHLAELK